MLRQQLFHFWKVAFAHYDYKKSTKLQALVAFHSLKIVLKVHLRPSGLSSVRLLSFNFSFPVSLSIAFLRIFSIRTSSLLESWNSFLPFCLFSSTEVNIVPNSEIRKKGGNQSMLIFFFNSIHNVILPDWTLQKRALSSFALQHC